MSHTYKHGKFQFPSVTTIIGECSDKKALVQWSANATRDYIIDHYESMQGMGIDQCLNAARFDYRRLSREALDIGSEVHNQIEMFFKTKLKLGDKLLCFSAASIGNKQIENCLRAFLKFHAEHDARPTKLEFTVYGDSGWAGTMDYKGLLDDTKTLIDYKSSKAIYMDSMGPQLAAYWVADGRECEQAGILRLDKITGEYELKLIKPKMLEKYYKRFECMVALYFENHPIIKKKAGV